MMSENNMENKLPIIALIYDFDGTLAPGNMQEYDFLNAIGITDPQKFWNANTELKKHHDASEVLSYMKLMLDESKSHHVPIKRDVFKQYGASIILHPGVKNWFKIINTVGENMGFQIKHYINSSGLQEIIEGTSIYSYFEAVYACRYMYDENGVACWPAVAVDFTQKTQFMYMIQKGVKKVSDNGDINRHKDDAEKPIPFQHMIYFGDGITDIPCMKMLKQNGGYSIAIYQEKKEESNSRKSHTACDLVERNICDFACEANYKKNGPVYNTVVSILEKIASQEKYIQTQSQNFRELRQRQEKWDMIPENERVVQFLLGPFVSGLALTIECQNCHKEVQVSIYDLPDIADMGSIRNLFRDNHKRLAIKCPNCDSIYLADINFYSYIGEITLYDVRNGKGVAIKECKVITFDSMINNAIDIDNLFKSK